MNSCCLTPSQVGSVEFANGRLSFLDVSGDVLGQLDLQTLVVRETSNHLELMDRYSRFGLTLAQASSMGLTADMIRENQSAGAPSVAGLDQYTSGTVTLTGGTYNSISIFVQSGTVDVNGISIASGVSVGWAASPGSKIANDIVIDSFVAATVIVGTTT